MGIRDKLYHGFMRKVYTDRGLTYSRSDEVVFKIWFYVLPYLLILPLLFWLLRYMFITYLLEKKGLGYLVGYAIIITMIKPMLIEFIREYLKFSSELKEVKRNEDSNKLVKPKRQRKA